MSGSNNTLESNPLALSAMGQGLAYSPHAWLWPIRLHHCVPIRLTGSLTFAYFRTRIGARFFPGLYSWALVKKALWILTFSFYVTSYWPPGGLTPYCSRGTYSLVSRCAAEDRDDSFYRPPIPWLRSAQSDTSLQRSFCSCLHFSFLYHRIKQNTKTTFQVSCYCYFCYI